VSVIGCAPLPLVSVMAEVLALRGRDGIVFRNDDGLDEFAATDTTTLWEVRDGNVERSTIDAVADLGLHHITSDALRGGQPEENAAVVRSVLGGASGPIRETVIANAALGLAAEGSVPGTAEGPLVDRVRAGMIAAAQSIDSGAAEATLQRWARATQAAA